MLRTWRTCTPSNCWANFRAVSRRSWRRLGSKRSWLHMAPHPPLHAVAPVHLKHPRQTSKPTSIQRLAAKTQNSFLHPKQTRTVWSIPSCYPSIFREQKTWIHLAFGASKHKLNVRQTCHTWNPCECKHFRPPSRVALLPSKLRLPAFSTQDTKPLKQLRTPPNFEKMWSFSQRRCTSNAPGVQGAAMRRPRTTSVTSVTVSVAASATAGTETAAWMERSSAETSWEKKKVQKMTAWFL